MKCKIWRESIMSATFMANENNIERKWLVVDAAGVRLGRLSSEVATLLRGKHKPTYTPHADTGDHVIIINAEKMELTGNKEEAKMYYRHSGYPGGLKGRNAAEMLDKFPERMIELAVKGMLPKGPLGRKMGKKLHVYRGSEHKNQGQQPEAYELRG